MIELGDVFYLRCGLCDPPKPKFFVVAQVQPLRMLLINSEINAFVLSKPRHRALHVPLRQCDQELLKHDSYLACDQISHEYNYEQLLDQMNRDPGIRVGRLSQDVMASVAVAFKGNHHIPKKYLADLVPLWKQWLDPNGE